MSYTLQEQYNSKNQVPGAQAGNTWGLGPRKVTSITIHHWGNPGQQFDVVRDFLCTNNTPTSAHYVAQDGLVACIVSPDDCAFHAGNAEGNTFSVGIECRPEATDGDYQTVGELVAFLRGIYGDVPLYPHNHWFATACPGDYDLSRIDAIARGTTPTPQENTVTPEQIQEIKLFVQACVNDSINKMWATEAVTQKLIQGIPASVVGFNYRPGTNLAGILDAIAAKPSGTPAPAAVDVDALVARLRAELPAAIRADLAQKLV